MYLGTNKLGFFKGEQTFLEVYNDNTSDTHYNWYILYAIKPSKVSETVFILSVASLNRCIYIAIDCMVKDYGDKY